MELLKRSLIGALALAGGLALGACETAGDREMDPAGRSEEPPGRAAEPGVTGPTTEESLGGEKGEAGGTAQ